MATNQSPEHRHVEVDRELSFSKVDKDASGTVELEEVKSALPNVPSERVAEMFDKADINKDGHLDRQEYMSFLASLWNNPGTIAEVVVLPRRERTSSRRMRQTTGTQTTGTGDALDSHPAEIEKKFPVFIVLISVLEWLIFTFLMYPFVVWIFIFHPLRRYEIWRFVTVMLLHSSWGHLIGNLIMQLILGCLLESIHHWKRVGTVYLAGVLFGTLASSIIQPWSFLVGASGGVYALLIAHLATIILNWKEMDMAPLRCFLLLAYIGYDVWLVISNEVIHGNKSNTSHAGHLGGALAGLLIGLNVLKNFEQDPWELKLQKVCRVLAVVFLVVAVIANIGFQIQYFASDPKLFKDPFQKTNITLYNNTSVNSTTT